MANNPIGISFIPSSQNQQATGPSQGSAEGALPSSGSSDLGTAFKILSLRLPTTLSAQAPAAPSLLKSPGMAGNLGATGAPAPNGPQVGSGAANYDPYAAVFAALLRAMGGVGDAGTMGAPTGGSPDAGATPAVQFEQGAPMGQPSIGYRDFQPRPAGDGSATPATTDPGTSGNGWRDWLGGVGGSAQGRVLPGSY